MNRDVAEAVRLGQLKSRRTCSAYQQHCVELAVDELLRHPDAEGEPQELLSKALAHARTHLRRRTSVCRVVPGSHYLDKWQIAGGEQVNEEHHLIIEFDDWLRRSKLSAQHQRLLRSLLLGVTTADIAQALRLPAARAREHVSRARKAARGQLVAAG